MSDCFMGEPCLIIYSGRPQATVVSSTRTRPRSARVISSLGDLGPADRQKHVRDEQRAAESLHHGDLLGK